jgi:Chaperone of endosialidase
LKRNFFTPLNFHIMKKIAPLAFMLFFLSITHQSFAQLPLYRGVPWEVFVMRQPVSFPWSGFPNTAVTAELTYKDRNGNILYKEIHDAVLSEFSRLRVFVGEGTQDPNSPYTIETLPFLEIYSLCYTLTVHDPEGDRTIMGEHTVGSTPKSVIAENALNANAFAKRTWDPIPLTVEELFTPPDDITMCFLTESKTIIDQRPVQTLRSILMNRFIRASQAPSAVNATLLKYFALRTGLGYPVVFGDKNITEIENWITIYAATMLNFYNAFAVKVPEAHHGSLSHPTAAIYAENIFDPLGVGLFSNGASRGSYNQGQTGMLGITNGTGNGAGSWSRVGSAPAGGGFKYGAFAEDQGLANSWAAAIFGDGFYTGTWMQSSDRRLKTEIRAQSNSLSKILQLRPSQYKYREDTPYSLPEGIHHGFIAQEMEEVLPELVSDVTMPVNTDPDKMGTSETVQYKAINYIELIPMLTSALQELNAKVEAQAGEIARLSSELKACSKPK